MAEHINVNRPKQKPDYLLTPPPEPLSEEKPMTSEVQELINEFRAVVEEKVGRPMSRFEGVNYKTQTVLGKNYFVKIDVGDNRVVHVRVHISPEGVNSLMSIKHFTDALDRDIVYF